jgi:tripartite-type tricarboxylate transporter receptor subunit TctC
MGNTRNRYPGRRRFLKQSAALSAGAASLANPAIVLGQGPSNAARPVRILVGAPPGGTTDTVARAVATGMAKALGQQVVVENRGGALGNVAAEAVARSAPDGTTLLVSFTSHTINATLHPSLPFDPVADFTPISLLATSPSLLIGHPSIPANSLAELVALVKRLAQFPEAPAIAEVVKGFESNAWFGLFGPAQLSADVTERVYAAARRALAQPEVRKRLDHEALEIVGNAPAEFARFVQEDIQRWEKVVRYAGARPG